ncbi:excinuclease ABC subunit C [Legionella geestiana]|uniref:UvrABC system protein C n=1 Tax=Legionella geestiana TaxID=45065 RepID=A0A0W0TTT7_9GAMM|nr:excinuclease ABC subunit UvrC [Legionella geestiana]KTC98934.1 excinuclease ABC subunit C [Legionella geestiana]QBS13025.1 excinuclease ABC subunit UvrC [Legionella geestiana]QDQ39298.1 excinuclease ABC subunit UvrC [Legionella geestiana]STX54465.1 excinuclease ABC subunit [Legionella geestiana]
MNEAFSSPELAEQVAHLTSAPGVYRMFDARGVVIYVGKARNLKKRVSSYFNRGPQSPKTRVLVSQIAAIAVDVTRSETEALLLESNLIKSLRPKYNILLRDDKSYPFIAVSMTHAAPAMRVWRGKKKPAKGEFFGPFPNAPAVYETLNMLQKIFKIRNCSDNFFAARKRPCLQYQIKRCSAPCTGMISPEDYRQSVTDALRFLQGKCQQVLEAIESRMEAAVARLAFEEAAILRDQARSLRQIQEQQGMHHRDGDADIIAVEAVPGFACIQLCSARAGQVLGGQHWFPTLPSDPEQSSEALWEEVFEAFVAFYYLDNPERIPAVIITNRAFSARETLENLLTEKAGKRVKIVTKVRGVRARWLDFAVNNLQTAISGHKASQSLMQARYQALAGVLDLDHPPMRMECFDISHTQGEETVASCVVFDANGPLPAEYRRFDIKDIVGGDDYAAMEQVLTRRLRRQKADNALPDMMIVDGGKGQYAVAQRVFEALQIKGVVLLGIAKGPDRRAGFERLILGDAGHEITLPAESPALHLLQHIRDEAHRFAITAHRKKRARQSLHSRLEDIEGIGSARRQSLLRRFGGMRGLLGASVEEIARVKGIGPLLAGKIWEFLHPDRESPQVLSD